jgi:hypothetical protein
MIIHIKHVRAESSEDVLFHINTPFRSEFRMSGVLDVRLQVQGAGPTDVSSAQVVCEICLFFIYYLQEHLSEIGVYHCCCHRTSFQHSSAFTCTTRRNVQARIFSRVLKFDISMWLDFTHGYRWGHGRVRHRRASHTIFPDRPTQYTWTDTHDASYYEIERANCFKFNCLYVLGMFSSKLPCFTKGSNEKSSNSLDASELICQD